MNDSSSVQRRFSIETDEEMDEETLKRILRRETYEINKLTTRFKDLLTIKRNISSSNSSSTRTITIFNHEPEFVNINSNMAEAIQEFNKMKSKINLECLQKVNSQILISVVISLMITLYCLVIIGLVFYSEWAEIPTCVSEFCSPQSCIPTVKKIQPQFTSFFYEITMKTFGFHLFIFAIVILMGVHWSTLTINVRIFNILICISVLYTIMQLFVSIFAESVSFGIQYTRYSKRGNYIDISQDFHGTVPRNCTSCRYDFSECKSPLNADLDETLRYSMPILYLIETILQRFLTIYNYFKLHYKIARLYHLLLNNTFNGECPFTYDLTKTEKQRLQIPDSDRIDITNRHSLQLLSDACLQHPKYITKTFQVHPVILRDICYQLVVSFDNEITNKLCTYNYEANKEYDKYQRKKHKIISKVINVQPRIAEPMRDSSIKESSEPMKDSSINEFSKPIKDSSINESSELSRDSSINESSEPMRDSSIKESRRN